MICEANSKKGFVISDQYHLGTSDAELDRLGYQHQVWHDVAVELWQSAGIAEGQRILDLGSGPGFATVDLARLVGPDGHLDAVDSSERFLTALQERCSREQLYHVTTHQCDVHELALSDESVDGVFARWLLCFVANPEQVIAEVHRVLRPGMPFILQDYFNYRAVQMFPPQDSFSAVLEAYYQSAIVNGGSYDIGGDLPKLLQSGGFRVETLKPICRIARPGTPRWRWFTMFSENYVPRLVEQGLLTKEMQCRFEDDLEAASRDQSAFFFTPPMIGIVAIREG